jgi:hypothetical protein
LLLKWLRFSLLETRQLTFDIIDLYLIYQTYKNYRLPYEFADENTTVATYLSGCSKSWATVYQILKNLATDAPSAATIFLMQRSRSREADNVDAVSLRWVGYRQDEVGI